MAFFHEPSRPKQGPEGKFGGGGLESAETRVPGGMLVLTLDDVLSRVPTRALKPGLHDPSRRLHFAMDELLEGISRGRATIMLSKLAERYPETFEAPAPGAEDAPIYLPLQKLMQQIGRATPPAVDKPAEKQVLPVIEAAPVVPVTQVLAPVKAPERVAAEPDPIVEAPVTRLLRRLKVMQEPVESAPVVTIPATVTTPVPAPVSAPAASIPHATAVALQEPKEALNASAGSPAHQGGATPRNEEQIPVRASVAPAASVSVPPRAGVSDAGGVSVPDRVSVPSAERVFVSGTAGVPPASEAVLAPAKAGVQPPSEAVLAPGRAGVSPAYEGVLARAVSATVEPAPAAPTFAPPHVPDVPIAASKPAPVPEEIPPAMVEQKPAPPKSEPPKPEEKPAPVTPPPLPVAPPPEAKTPAPPPPAPVLEPAPEVPHSPILENPPANLETNVRIPSGRPLVRPPSLQGPAGLVMPETAPPSAPAMPGFVFAPRPKGQLSDFAQPAHAPEAERPEVQIPPLFPIHPGPLEEEEPPVVAPPPAAHPEPPPLEPQPEPEAVQEPLAETPRAETPPEPAATPEPPPVSAHPNGSTPSTESTPSTPSSGSIPPDEDDDNDATQRQLLHATRPETGARNELLGTHFSLARIDQEPLQAIFMTEEFLDLARVSQLSCGFPGITGCMIVAGDALAQGGERPAGLDAQALCQLTKQLSAVALAFPEELPAVQTYTLHVGNRALSIFARPHVSLCLVHSHRGFLPGVRERLAAVADTLSRGLSGEAQEG